MVITMVGTAGTTVETAAAETVAEATAAAAEGTAAVSRVAVSDDWRITASAYGYEDLAPLARRASELAPDLDANAGHAYVFAYASDEASARTVRWALEEAASETGIGVDVVVERWNPGRAEWQDPALPVEPVPKLAPWVDIDFDALRYEVRLHVPSTHDGVELTQELRAEGARFLGDGSRVLELGAYDEEEAQAIADDLRLRAPVGSEVEVRELTAFRRWLAKERMLGNYDF
jgi:hypothetical protein